MDIQKELMGSVYQKGYEASQAVVGISPGNSYFKRDTIEELVDYCSDRFDSVTYMIPEKPSIHNFVAKGYSVDKAIKKAKKYANTLRNHCKRAGAIDFVYWDKLGGEYQNSLEEVMDLYESNLAFRTDVRLETNDYLKGEGDLDEAVNYLLKELAYLGSLKGDVTYVYHQPWEIFEKFASGVYDYERDVGFFIL